jgi:zinc transport system ATP-binding protein
MDVVEIKDLSFAYDKQVVLEDINLTIKNDDFFAIIGPNGGGKSTLLKLIMGLYPLKKGYIRIFDKTPLYARELIGYVPQNTNVNTDFPISVLDVVLMGHKEGKKALFGYTKQEKACALGALASVGIEQFAHRKIGELSGGQRQRVMIARALCAHPKILILDEPTASIDPTGQKEIYQLLKTLNKDIPIVVVSHDIFAVMEYATQVAHINKTVTMHDVRDKVHTFHTHDDQHICEVELLQMLGANGCEVCADTNCYSQRSDG